MKAIKQINQGVQILFISLLAVIGVTAMVNDGGIILLLYLAIPLGAYQLGLSIVHVIYTQGKSKYLVHLIFSVLYLLVLFTTFEQWDNMRFAEGIMVLIPALLAFYSFYLSLSPDRQPESY